jgi:hypothetical protein
MARGMYLKFAAVAVLTGASAPAFGVVVPLVTENFNTNTDVYWENQNTDPDQPLVGGRHNYGWANSDLTGTSVDPDGAGPLSSGTGAGEFGGVFARDAHPAGVAAAADFYGFNIGTVNPRGSAGVAGDTLRFSAVTRYITAGASGILIGFSNGAPSSAGGTASGSFQNFIGIVLGDGRTIRYRAHDMNNVQLFNVTPAGSNIPNTGGGDPDGAGPLTDSGTPVRIDFLYDPGADSAANGTLDVSIDGVALAQTTITAAQKGAIGDLTRFGFFSVKTTPPSGTATVFFDDVTFSSFNPVPEPASVGLLAMSAGAMLQQRRRSSRR